MIFRLAVRNLLARRVQLLLTSLAVALSVALMVSVSSGFASLAKGVRSFWQKFSDARDFNVQLGENHSVGIDQKVLDDLRRDSRILHVWGRVDFSLNPIDASGKPLEGGRIRLTGLELDDDSVAKKLELHEGRWFNPDAANEIVIDNGVEKGMNKKLGDTLRFAVDGGVFDLKIVGIIHKPDLIATFVKSAYTRLDTMKKIAWPKNPTRLSFVQGQFVPGIDQDAFAAEWQPRLVELDQNLHLDLVKDTPSSQDRIALLMQLVSYVAGAVSMLAATFIVAGTLSMGVAERQRVLAMLRAIGATKLQTARLIVYEGVAVAIVGFAIGSVLGVAFVNLLAWWLPQVFFAGVAIDVVGIAVAGVIALGACLLASVLPAWRVTRIDPLAAMSSISSAVSGRFPWRPLVAGLLLLTIDPILLHVPWSRLTSNPDVFLGVRVRELTIALHLLLGLPLGVLGFFLLCPALVVACEKLLATPLAFLSFQRPELLRQQLSSGLWRAAGTAAAMMVGLSVLIVLYTQSTSALNSWQLPNKFPDAFVYTSMSSSLSPEQIDRLKRSDAVKPGEVMPISVFSPRFGENLAVAGSMAAMLPDATLFIGIDPSLAFDMMQLDYRQGERDTAQRMMERGVKITLANGQVEEGTFERPGETLESLAKTPATFTPLKGPARLLGAADLQRIELGRFLIVTTEFNKLKGINFGDPLTLHSGVLGQRTTAYTVVAVVWSPGIDVMIASFDMAKQMQNQTAACVFGTNKSAHDDFGITDARMAAVNLRDGQEKKALIEKLQVELGASGLNVGDIRKIKYDIEQTMKMLVQVGSTIAWAAMIVASLGTANTIMASVRSRVWQMGVLRAIGLTRGGLLRLILGESLLQGVCGAAMGILCGAFFLMNARRLQLVTLGLDIPLALPWDVIGLGVGLVLVVGLLAGLWPALWAARTQPLQLLQSGRSGV